MFLEEYILENYLQFESHVTSTQFEIIKFSLVIAFQTTFIVMSIVRTYQ